MTSMAEKDSQLSISQFLEAVQKCTEAKDFLCMGESYEQISSQYNALGDYKKAHYYFNLGRPLLRKFGTDENLSAAYNNYANVFTNEKNYKTAITYIDSAISIAVKNKNLHSEMVFRANLGATYISLKEFNKTLDIIDYCEPINIKNNWQDNLAHNYYCRSIIYQNQGKYKEALDYLNKHYSVKESIAGKKVISQISALAEKYKKEEQQLILNKKQLELEKSLRAKERYAGISFSMLSAIFVGIWLWRRQNIRNKKEAIENQKNLTDLTNLMIEKSAVILELEEKLSETKSSIEIANAQEEERTLYSQRILTNNDWSSFKYSFEKVYPGYLKKVRDQYPTITEAEERLFLCLKLNLKSKETALMLGISNDSVKKSRNRLRKRLNLIEKEDLETFVRNFTDNILQKTG